VIAPGFDPAGRAVLESDPGIAASATGAEGTAAYAETEPEDVRVHVDAPTPSIVLVRTSWDAGWSATVDGRPAPVLPVDGFLQGVPVTAGAHEVRLTYRDPSIGRGLAASGVVWSLWTLAIAGATVLRRRRARAGAASASPGEPPAPATPA
jgi:hypothetical protein